MWTHSSIWTMSKGYLAAPHKMSAGLVCRLVVGSCSRRIHHAYRTFNSHLSTRNASITWHLFGCFLVLCHICPMPGQSPHRHLHFSSCSKVDHTALTLRSFSMLRTTAYLLPNVADSQIRLTGSTSSPRSLLDALRKSFRRMDGVFEGLLSIISLATCGHEKEFLGANIWWYVMINKLNIGHAFTLQLETRRLPPTVDTWRAYHYAQDFWLSESDVDKKTYTVCSSRWQCQPPGNLATTPRAARLNPRFNSITLWRLGPVWAPRITAKKDSDKVTHTLRKKKGKYKIQLWILSKASKKDSGILSNSLFLFRSGRILNLC